MRKFTWLLGSILLSIAIISGCNSNPSGSNNHPESAAPASESAAPAPQSTAPAAESAAPAKEGISSAELEAAMKAATEYKSAEYTVKASADIMSIESIEQRNEVMKPYFTADFYQKAVSTRYTALPLQVVHKQQLSIQPDNLQLTLSDGHKQDIAELKYTVDLVLLNEKGQEQQRVPMEGILTLFKIEGAWLVQGDRFDNAAFSKLING
ncbi:hypothetical protein PAECIP111892_04735 [Paenibacillus auburnensis]|uniref:Lipoprotein n=1 Tax=Paenibacillus auburnensis TaxID=2905649 RepID=A0ABM9CQW9_9BACL|nr:hypothetical protein [Paenibacillus auburnensis]CAH1219378.1 hypothetical protein PAECIP111892_04735 [Paenibacillus auburnensis]